jgi:hypothetical protein
MIEQKIPDAGGKAPSLPGFGPMAAKPSGSGHQEN